MNKYFALDNIHGTIEVAGPTSVLAIAVDDKDPVVVYTTGPSGSIAALIAKMQDGGAFQFNPEYFYSWKGQTRLRPNDSGQYKIIRTNDTMIERHHVLALHSGLLAASPEKNGYVLASIGGDATFKQRIYDRVSEIVDIPLLPGWAEYIFKAGSANQGIVEIPSLGCRVYKVIANPEAWTTLITSALKSGKIKLGGL